MGTRIIKFNSFRNHAWFSRIFKKLKSPDLDFCESFISKNDSKDKAEFEMAVNRVFLNAEKPKAWKEMMELLTACNS